jgi:hypothetical protein
MEQLIPGISAFAVSALTDHILEAKVPAFTGGENNIVRRMLSSGLGYMVGAGGQVRLVSTPALVGSGMAFFLDEKKLLGTALPLQGFSAASNQNSNMLVGEDDPLNQGRETNSLNYLGGNRDAKHAQFSNLVRDKPKATYFEENVNPTNTNAFK